MCDCDFFISRSPDGLLDLSTVHYRGKGSKISNRAYSLGMITSQKMQQYQQCEVTYLTPGNLLMGNNPFVTVLRTYFIRVNDESPRNELDLRDVYVIDGKSKLVKKCRIDVFTSNPQKPMLRFLENGRVLLDDETTASSFFELNEEWWSEKLFMKKMVSAARRTDKFTNSVLSQEVQIDNTGWHGPNLGPDIEHFIQGGDFARQLEALGSYCTGNSDRYGDVLRKELTSKSMRQSGVETTLVWMSSLEDQWVDLERSIRNQDIKTVRSLVFQDEKEKMIKTHQTVESIIDDGINYDEFEFESEMDFENELDIDFTENQEE
jgi:hypothetical protein